MSIWEFIRAIFIKPLVAPTKPQVPIIFPPQQTKPPIGIEPPPKPPLEEK